MRHLITAGLPYINGIKHLGNLVGSLLPADVYARFLRQRGEDVVYICGTDEHGAPAELAARDAGVPVDEFCAQQHEVQADIYRRFGLSFDNFGRTSTAHNHELTQRIFAQLDANGFIDEHEMKQVYSKADGRFLPDRYIVGTCPHCGYEAARGDQCENCTRLLDPTDLKNPRSAISGSADLELRTTKHLFLRLPDLQPKVGEWVEKQTQWPALTRQIAQKWLGEGLKDRCITRDLTWGVRVPKPGMEDKVFYVWFDAPIGYIASTWDWADKQGDTNAWERFWLDGDVRYTQFMGKDNLPFHTIMFPAMLIGASERWKLPDQIKGFHWLNYYGGKFSTSQKRGVFTDAALELYPADYWRYALLAFAPETSDSVFTWESFAQTVNKDLAGILGNFVNRVSRFCASKMGGEVVPSGGVPEEIEKKLEADCAEQVRAFDEALQALQFRQAIQALRTLWTLGNGYLDTRAPWSLIKTDPAQAEMVVRTCFNLMRLYAVAARPVIPGIAETILDSLQLTPEERAGAPAAHLALNQLAGRPFTVVPPIVRKIEDAEVEALKERFGA